MSSRVPLAALQLHSPFLPLRRYIAHFPPIITREGSNLDYKNEAQANPRIPTSRGTGAHSLAPVCLRRRWSGADLDGGGGGAWRLGGDSAPPDPGRKAGRPQDTRRPVQDYSVPRDVRLGRGRLPTN